MRDTASVAPGEIRGRGLGRQFVIRLTQTRSLKEAILHRERPRNRELWALRDVDIDVHPGEAFGIVGPNGSGKSTLFRMIVGDESADDGVVTVPFAGTGASASIMAASTVQPRSR